MPHIRPATVDDAAAISTVLLASIRQLCVADHQDDPAALAAWCAHKSPDDVRDWITSGTGLRVALQGNEIAAVGAFSAKGDILLLYVGPGFQGQGHSAALLAAMEDELAALGLYTAHLTSTGTAHGFYLAKGWQDNGPQSDCYLTAGQPMRKHLIAQA
jgi:GNAT superfamily N-acetyltransferase